MKLKKLNNWSLPIILLISIANHLFTFFAYTWYAGMDSYSYDVCGLQLVSGKMFDIFPIMYRPPLIPIFKNILYLIFEGHPFALSIFVHFIGVITTVLVYRLGCKFNKKIGFITGLAMALNINMAVFYHSISTLTFYVPLLILAADCFVVWMRKFSSRSLIYLIITTFLCCMTRTESIILVPVFFIFGWISLRNWRQPALFLLIFAVLYNLVCSWYYCNLGYWRVTYKAGWALSYRLLRPRDSLFSKYNGPSSLKVYEYLTEELPESIKNIRKFESLMYSFNLAQDDLGYIEADKLFKRAFIEAIKANPVKFTKFTFLRMLGHFDLYSLDFNHKESPYASESGHMWGFDGERAENSREKFEQWSPLVSKLDSPLQWEREVILARFKKFLGFANSIPKVPETFKLSSNISIDDYGKFKFLSCGDGVMTERLWNCRYLDKYFYLAYWGQKGWSELSLNILKYWDAIFMPNHTVKIIISWLMWILWVSGIFISKKREVSIFLGAFLIVVVFQAVSQAIFSDNFGGRFALYMIHFKWLGALCGILAFIERGNKKLSHKLND